MISVDLASTSIRDLNERLHKLPPDTNERAWRVLNPKGAHAIAAGLTLPIEVIVDGHAGYYCAGMNKEATVIVNGHAGVGVGENIMSGEVRVKGNASQSAAASGQGGLVVIEGDASARCGISMKGVDIVVGGSVGHMSAFMAQSGNLVVCGDAGAQPRQLHLRSQALHPRQRRKPGRGLRRKEDDPGTYRQAGAPAGARGHQGRRRSDSAATARRASSTTSIPITPTPISAGIEEQPEMTVDPRGLRPSHSFPPHILSEIHRAADQGAL